MIPFDIFIFFLYSLNEEKRKNAKYYFQSKQAKIIIAETFCTGYYRVNYESENWRKIVHYLNSKEYKNISVINRAKIIDDAFHFMITRQLNTFIFWELTKYLSQETDYAAWYPMIKVLEYMSNALPLSKDEINFTHIKVMSNKYYLSKNISF